VIVDVVDPEAALLCALDLRAELLLDLFRISVVLLEGFGRRKEVAVGIDEAGHGGATKHRTPAIVLPLGVEGEVDAHGNVRVPLQHLHRFLIPGRREHHRHRDREAGFDEPLERHVDAVAHAGVVAADDQVDWACRRGWANGRLGLTHGVRRRARRDRAGKQGQAEKQPRTTLRVEKVGSAY